MSNPKVHICGHPAVHIPDDDCSECIRELNLFKNEVHHNYYTKEQTYNKTEVNNLIAGLELTKANILNALGYEEIPLAMTDTDGNEHEWTVIAQIQTP